MLLNTRKKKIFTIWGQRFSIALRIGFCSASGLLRFSEKIGDSASPSLIYRTSSASTNANTKGRRQPQSAISTGVRLVLAAIVTILASNRPTKTPTIAKLATNPRLLRGAISAR